MWEIDREFAQTREGIGRSIRAGRGECFAVLAPPLSGLMEGAGAAG
jgi:hypothetical protein